jgi:small-conductance mechanosensitive channel
MILWQQTPPPADPPVITEVFRQLYANFIHALPGILTGALVFLIFLIVAAVGKRIIASVAPHARADTGVVLLLSRVFYYGVLIFGILTALPLTGLNISALVAGLGLTGFAIGFALKDVLSNLLAGIMLLVYRPFHIGDHIKMGDHEGVITTIRMRDTVLNAADGRSVIIPNTKLITEIVVNNATAQLARDTVHVRLTDEADIGRARNVLLESLGAETELVKRVEPQVAVGQGGGDDIRLEGAFWYDPRRTHRPVVQTQVCERLRRAFAAANIKANFSDPPAITPHESKTPVAETEEREERI